MTCDACKFVATKLISVASRSTGSITRYCVGCAPAGLNFELHYYVQNPSCEDGSEDVTAVGPAPKAA